jgi:cell division protein FtsL
MGKNNELRHWLPLRVMALMVALAIGTVWLRLSIVRTTYAIDQADRQLRALQQAREQMDLKVTALRSPRRLELIARTQFGLAPPRSDQIVHFNAHDGAGSSMSPLSHAVNGAIAIR